MKEERKIDSLRLFEIIGNIDDTFITEAAVSEDLHRSDILSEASEDLPPSGRPESGVSTASGRFHRRKLAVLLAALFSLILTACAAYIAVEWNDTLKDQFQPGEKELEQMKHGIQDVNAVSECGGWTLTVSQTLGGADSIYIDLTAEFSESADLSDSLGLSGAVSSSDSAGAENSDEEHLASEDAKTESETSAAGQDVSIEQQNISIVPTEYQFFKGRIPYDEVKGLSMEEVCEAFSGSRLKGALTSMRTVSSELHSGGGSASFLFYVQSEDLPASGGSSTDTAGESGEITLCIPAFEFQIEGELICTAEGPFVVSWDMKNSAPSVHAEFSDNDARPGYLDLSGTMIHIVLSDMSYEPPERDFYGMKELFRIRMKDGSFFSHISGGGGIVQKGHLDYSASFSEILVLEEVEAVIIRDKNGDREIKVARPAL